MKKRQKHLLLILILATGLMGLGASYAAWSDTLQARGKITSGFFSAEYIGDYSFKASIVNSDVIDVETLNCSVSNLSDTGADVSFSSWPKSWNNGAYLKIESLLRTQEGSVDIQEKELDLRQPDGALLLEITPGALCLGERQLDIEGLFASPQEVKCSYYTQVEKQNSNWLSVIYIDIDPLTTRLEALATKPLSLTLEQITPLGGEETFSTNSSIPYVTVEVAFTLPILLDQVPGTMDKDGEVVYES